MKTENRPAIFLAIALLMFFAYILHQKTVPQYSVVIQAGHEGRLKGNTGAERRNRRRFAYLRHPGVNERDQQRRRPAGPEYA